MSSSMLRLLTLGGLLLLGILNTVEPQQSGESSGDGLGSGDNCTQGEIRLVNGTTEFEGRVELCYKSEWRTVRGDMYDWTVNDTYTVCRQVMQQLGEEFNGGIARYNLYFGRGGQDQLVYLNNLECKLNDATYLSCEIGWRISGPGEFDHDYDIGVTCIPPNVQGCVPPTTTQDQFQCQNGYCLRANSSNTTPSSRTYSLVGGPPDVCDSYGDDNCGDCSDECHCNYRVEGNSCRSQPTTVCICSDSEFQCSNGFCTDMSNFCDGYDNCGDASDEKNQECRELRSRNIGQRELGIAVGVSIGFAVIIVLIWLAVFGVCMLVRPCPLRKAFSEEPTIPVESETDGSQTQGIEL